MKTKSNHHQLSDSEFIEQFTKGTLNPELFNHEAHLRLAWLYIKKFGVKQAEKDIQKQLLNFDVIVGKGDKYHTTLTIVSIRIVNHFMQKSRSNNFLNFINEFPQLKLEFRELINTHYSYDIFESEKAKIKFLEPDLIDFKK
ncbi:hypothetical protein [Tenacibaculum xiamenense]|uniref:hypothetical protein n=1 Tax=Tenacibaculum xiamenense TaxID=1261553 RepID=UPI00389660CF